MEKMTKEEIKELIRKKFESNYHPNVKDDFDMIWDIREKYMPFTEKDYNPKPKLEIVKSVELHKIENKTQLIEALKDVSDEATISIDTNYENLPEMDVLMRKTIDPEANVFKLYNTLHNWACTGCYAMYKKIYLLEKENEELKKMLK